MRRGLNLNWRREADESPMELARFVASYQDSSEMQAIESINQDGEDRMNDDKSLVALILMSVPQLTVAEIDVLIPTLQSRKQRLVDDAVCRDIRADARRSPAHQPSSAMGPNQGQGQIHTHPSTRGWVDAPKLGQQPGIDLIDRMIDTQDRIDAATLKGG
jgi:hypothetical protein